jgi:hypothetical protein
MSRASFLMRSSAMALAIVVAAFVVVPACTMPECDDSGVSACSDFTPVCDQCPGQVVMRHEPVDAVSTSSPSLPSLAIAALIPAPAAEALSAAPAPTSPVPTASPPPLEPLGSKLLI